MEQLVVLWKKYVRFSIHKGLAGSATRAAPAHDA